MDFLHVRRECLHQRKLILLLEGGGEWCLLIPPLKLTPMQNSPLTWHVTNAVKLLGWSYNPLSHLLLIVADTVCTTQTQVVINDQHQAKIYLYFCKYFRSTNKQMLSVAPCIVPWSSLFLEFKTLLALPSQLWSKAPASCKCQLKMNDIQQNSLISNVTLRKPTNAIDSSRIALNVEERAV